MTLVEYFQKLDKEDGRKRTRAGNMTILRTLDRLYEAGAFKLLHQANKIDSMVKKIRDSCDKKSGYADTTMECFTYNVADGLPYLVSNAKTKNDSKKMDELKEVWMKKSFEFKSKYLDRQKTNQYTEKEKEDKPEKGMATIFEGWEKLKPRLDEVLSKPKPTAKDFTDAQEAILFLMLTKFQQFRSAFLYAQYGLKQEGVNRYNPKTKLFYFHGKGHKGNPGDFQKDDDELHQYLAKWKRVTSRFQEGVHPNIFVNSEFKEHNLHSATTWVRRTSKKILGKPIGLRAIRHAHITLGFEKDPLASDEQVEQRAKWQMHSVEKHRTYRRINKKEEAPKKKESKIIVAPK